MQPYDCLSTYQKWFKLNRFIPFITILGAGLAIVFSIVKIIPMSTSDEIFIALLTLIAFDAFNERLNILEKIEKKLDYSNNNHFLRNRVELPTPDKFAQKASEICILVVHGASLFPLYPGFFREKILEGCKIRVVLLNPESPSLNTWISLSDDTNSKNQILSSMGCLGNLMLLPKANGKCKVKLSNIFLPFSLFMKDPMKETGSMIVEYHPYKLSIDRKPHFCLNLSDHPNWFHYYRQQFEQVWSESTDWRNSESMSFSN